MAVATSKLLQKSENFSLELLYLLGALGEKGHKLILIKRFQGGIVEAADYDINVFDAMADEITRIEPGTIYDELIAPESKVRCEWMQSTSGHIIVELTADRVVIKRNPLGQYEIDYGNTQQDQNNHVQQRNSTPSANTPRNDSRLLSANSSNPGAIALFY